MKFIETENGAVNLELVLAISVEERRESEGWCLQYIGSQGRTFRSLETFKTEDSARECVKVLAQVITLENALTRFL